MMKKSAVLLVCCSLLATASKAGLLSAQQAPAKASVPATVQPESVGFSSERLERLHALIRETVDQKQISGVVTILARHDKIVDCYTYGQRDMENNLPMTMDTIFRDYSMTKPVTGVAMMMLYEQGKWLPTDPISKYIPEFAHLKVYKGFDLTGRAVLVDPDHEPTMGELMSHTAGFTYGLFGSSAVDAMYRNANVMQSKNLHEMVEKLGNIPLLYQPGKGWTYSVSMDIEGYIIEKLSGQSLPDFFSDQIFKPLEMTDAGFYVPADKRSRFAAEYVRENGKEESPLVPRNAQGSQPNSYTEQPAMASGGGGMVSTAVDYYNFAQMLGNGGIFKGHRLLSSATIHMMATNHVPQELLDARQYGIAQHQLRPGLGYGFNVAVAFDPATAGLIDGKGTFWWDGAAGTWFWVDPTNDIVFVGMIQRMGPEYHHLEHESHVLVNQALIDPSK